LKLPHHGARTLEDVAPGEAAEVVAASTGFTLAPAVEFPGLAGVVKAVAVELYRESM